MKIEISKLAAYFKIEKLKNNKQVIAYLVCLLIATALWFLNALSKDYSTVLSYPVKYINPPNKQFVANELPNEFELKVNAHGFTLLRYKLSLSFSPVVLNLTNITANSEIYPEGYRVLTQKLVRRISDQISNEIEIVAIQPDFFYIKLDHLNTKLITVKPDIEMGFKDQFKLKGKVITKPEQVQITGPETVLDTLLHLSTEHKIFKGLDSNFEKKLKLISPENTTVKPGEVNIKIPVEKYTEKEIRIPVSIKNKPENTTIKLFPPEIKLTVLVGLSDFENINPSLFEAKVDYANVSTNSENLPVTIEKKPGSVQIIRFAPQNVEYLIETN